MKKQYYLVLDVETANSTEYALVYYLGYAVCDRKGKIYHLESFIISDIFCQERELMQSAYYAEKIPEYVKGIAEKRFQIVNFFQAKMKIKEVIDKWEIKEVFAYNANFDRTALNTTQRWLSKSKYRYFLPYGVEVHCIWHMACQLICTQKYYIKFCLENGFYSKSGNIKTSAEVVYAYMMREPHFEEKHTGLQDVLIEVQILAKCFAQHKKVDRNINRLCWRIPQKLAKEQRKILGL